MWVFASDGLGFEIANLINSTATINRIPVKKAPPPYEFLYLIGGGFLKRGGFLNFLPFLSKELRSEPRYRFLPNFDQFLMFFSAAGENFLALRAPKLTEITILH